MSDSRMLKDTALYMAAKAVEGVVGVATIYVLARLFAEDQIGRYTNWNITATTLAMLSIQWLSQSSSRYLNEYELKNEHGTFYRTVFISWLKVNLTALGVALLLGVSLSGAESSVPAFLKFMYGDGFTTMFTLAAMYFVTYNTSQMLIALLSVKRKVYINLIISVVSSSGKLILILGFSQAFGANIAYIFVSYILSDIFVIILASATLTVLGHIRSGRNSKPLNREFGRYGAPLVGNLATTTVLNNSDRFVITSYAGEAANGVYSTNYSIVSAAFTMLQTALMRGAYPTILRTWASGNKEHAQTLVSQAVRNYLVVAVPAVVGIGVLAKPLAVLLFKPSFARGYPVMVWVALGLVFLGLTEYSNKPWELSSKTRYIFQNSLIGGTVNITLNIVLMPRFGYMTAAYSTFAGFFVYFCLSKLGSRKLMKWQITMRTYASIAASAMVMGVLLQAAKIHIGVTKLTLLVYVFAGVAIYGTTLVLTGELNDEIRMLRNVGKAE